jgi:murein DD-endopeptidase MepM/ murein hydrolase activator NlpD
MKSQRIRTTVMLALLLMLVPLVASSVVAREPTSVQVSQGRLLIADSLFVYGPAVHTFNIQAFFAEHAQAISAYSEVVEQLGYELSTPEIVEYVAHHYSLNPQLLLSLLELKSGLLTIDVSTPDAFRYAMGHIEPGCEGLAPQLDWAATQLTKYFYGYPSNPMVTFVDGTAVILDADLNAGTTALAKFLATDATEEQWLARVGNGPGSFSSVYRSFFGDPLQDTGEVNTERAMLQPTLRLPWGCGEEWIYSQGPHHPPTNTAIDFAPMVGDCGFTDKKVVAARDGIVVFARDAEVKIDHDMDGNPGTGSGTQYYHVRDIQVSEGQKVSTGDLLGYPSCEGGGTGTHLHFGFIYNGAFVEADGQVLSEWEIHSEDTNGDGIICYGDEEKKTWTYCEGTMTKPGQQSRIASTSWAGQNHMISDNCPDLTLPDISFDTPPPEEKRWYKIDQTLPWTISDNESGVDRYEWWWEGQPHQLEDPIGNPNLVTDSAHLGDAGQGKTWLHVKAWNGAGRDHQEEIGWFGYDTIPPNIVFSSLNPATGRWYNTNKTLSWQVSDSEAGVKYFRWEWDDSSPGRQEYSDHGFTTLGAAGQGKHTLYVQAWDIATNSSAIQDGTLGWFGYDTIPPRSPSINEIGCHARNNQWQNSCRDPSFTWSATDPNGGKGSGVLEYAYAWGKEANVSIANWSSWSDTATCDPEPIDGVDSWVQYFLHVKSRDLAGNESSPATFGFWYDATDPTIADFSIDRGASTTNKTNVRLDVTANDTGSGVAAICVNDDGGACSDWRSFAGGSLFWTLTAMNHYTHTLYATVRDAAGNKSKVVSDAIYVDLDPPMPHSANYRICQYVVDLGGLEKITSPHYSLVSAIGQPWATGADVITSAGFMEQVGFLSAITGCLPISRTHAPTLPIFITPTLPSRFEVSINEVEGFYTNDPMVEVKAPAPNVAYVRISNSSAYSDTGWQTYQLTTTWSISVPATLGGRYATAEDRDYTIPHYIYVWFLDEWDNVYGPYFDVIFYDPIAPEGRVEILARGIDTVTLSLEAWDDNSGVVKMRIGEAPTFEGLSWQPYEEVVDWTLTSSGSVYVQFGDSAGNTSPVYVLELIRRIYLPVIFKLSS